MKLTEEMTQDIAAMLKSRSMSEVAAAYGCTVRTVARFVSAHGLSRSRDDESSKRSRIRKELVRSERRKSLFGLQQLTQLKVFSNKERLKLKYCLKRKGYKFFGRGSNRGYYDGDTKRDPEIERRAVKLGLLLYNAGLT